MPFDIPGAMTQLGVPSLSKGKLFSTGQGPGLTLIRSGMSAGFVGDCVLWLQETPCEQIIFLGTCGLITPGPELAIGTVVTPGVIFPFESFSALLTENNPLPEPLTVTDPLIQDMSLVGPRCVCVSFPSLHEEERFRPVFHTLKAEVIDMESHAFFIAARRIQRPAAALLVISDVVGVKTFCFDLSPDDKKSLANGISQACTIIKNFSI
ncbi:MAG: hypothetical protein HQL21_04200 [Candidatus Omnitrophica bacterium]|nr:hypothetical protein [Candidatus Omnitrophota bacterium]